MSYFHLTKIVTQGHTKTYHFLFHRLIQKFSDERARTCHVGCGMVAGWAGTAGLAVWGTLEGERGARGGTWLKPESPPLL